MRISFFPRHKPKKFSYNPIYYNPNKERIEKLKNNNTREKKSEDYKQILDFKSRWTSQRKGGYSHNRKKSNVRFLVILSLLLIISYWLVFK